MRLRATMMAMTIPLFSLLGACSGGGSPSHGGLTELRAGGGADHAPDRAMPGFAVVELFTSEGCSSCPPADKLLGQIAEQSLSDGTRVFPLAFHVDYWNSLGWTDPFSTEAASNRQREYARALHLDNVYTPQMIVNGRSELVGSDREKASAALSEALAREGENTVTLRLGTGREYGDILVEYEVMGGHAGKILNVALVESGLAVKVPRGENSGRTLRHDNVVRGFVTVPIDTAARGDLSIPVADGVQRKNLMIIAYVQDPASMAITGAASAVPQPLR